MLKSILGRVSAGEDLSMQDMSSAIDLIMQGQVPEEQIGLLLIGLRAKGETCEEIAGAAAAMRKHMVPIRTTRTEFIDTCGTGVTAAAGLPVAKHGNRSITSKTGSADVLAALGVNIEADVATVERCLEDVGICFCFAPGLHPAMRHVGPVRKKLAVPTIFNLLGPLCNPASAPFQLLGVGRPELRPLLADALARLGTQHAVVVCGDDGMDEVTLGGKTHVTRIDRGQVTELTWTPADFGLAEAGTEEMLVETPEESADMIRGIFDGAPGAARDIVVLNAAAALWTANPAQETRICARRAAEALESGAASRLLAQLVEASQRG